MKQVFADKKRFDKKNFIIIFLVIALLIFSVLYFIRIDNSNPELQDKRSISLITPDKTLVINVEVAKTADEQEKGLMFRKSLDKNKGMIFVFNTETMQTFWMKNTLIPLDIIFFDKDGKLLNVAKATPCTVPDNQCPIYSSENPAKYVLEMNAGWARENGVTNGAVLDVSVLTR